MKTKWLVVMEWRDLYWVGELKARHPLVAYVRALALFRRFAAGLFGYLPYVAVTRRGDRVFTWEGL